MSRTFTITYPDAILGVLQASPEQFADEARLAMAAKLFECGRLPSGLAAALAGMDRVDFLLSLHRQSVAMIDLDGEDLASDIAQA